MRPPRLQARRTRLSAGSRPPGNGASQPSTARGPRSRPKKHERSNCRALREGPIEGRQAAPMLEEGAGAGRRGAGRERAAGWPRPGSKSADRRQARPVARPALAEGSSTPAASARQRGDRGAVEPGAGLADRPCGRRLRPHRRIKGTLRGMALWRIEEVVVQNGPVITVEPAWIRSSKAGHGDKSCAANSGTPRTARPSCRPASRGRQIGESP